MNTPRKTRLYNELAKDYSPKRANMMICRYIEMLEGRIEALEKCCKVLETLIASAGAEPSSNGENGDCGDSETKADPNSTSRGRKHADKKGEA